MVMEDAEIPRIRRFNLNKLMDEFEGTDRDLKHCSQIMTQTFLLTSETWKAK